VTVVRSGRTVYVGGAFNMAGPVTGSGVPVHRTTGQIMFPYPRVTGTLRCVVPDGSGGWYVGGTFVAVGGMPRSNLAHLLRDGGVDDWSPDPDGEVLALALKGTTLYVGGAFTRVSGLPRRNIAALDVASGAATSWAPEADHAVRALMVHQGRLYVGGDFGSLGGQVRNSLAEIDLTTGAASDWNPDVGFSGTPGSVRALAALQDTIYVGGLFWTVGSAPRRHLAAVISTTGAPTSWNPDVTGPNDSVFGDPYISVLGVKGGSIYVGGHFTGIGSQSRSGLAEIARTSGLATAWDPGAVEVTCMAVRESTVYVGGHFLTVGGVRRRYLAEISLTSGAVTGWNPAPNDAVKALAEQGSVVYAGGTFSGIGSQWKPRSNLAAFDASTGELKAWDPNPDGFIVYTLVATRGRIYVGGYFFSIGGQVRYGLASVDTLTGAATEWDPSANSVVGSMAVAGDTLYVGGYFTTMGGQPRGRLASFDLNTGELTTWDPNAASDVYALALHGNTAYIGGFFWAIGGLTRKGIAAVDAVTGTILPWAPNTSDYCRALAISGDTVFVGGRFSTIGGQARSNLAAVDGMTGEVLPWQANTNSTVYSLAILHDMVFVGGNFFIFSGEARRNFAAVERSTGALLPWDPRLDSGVLSLTVFDDMLYVGGGIHQAGLTPVSNLTLITFAPPEPEPVPIPPRAAVTWIAPNPVLGSAMIRFELSSPGPVDLKVFDVQGRQISALLRGVMLTAGVHDIPLRTNGWAEGFYFLRLAAGSVTATRKFAVLR
jgi:putative pyrroloquinoline-quinone binding quinoprotein